MWPVGGHVEADGLSFGTVLRIFPMPLGATLQIAPIKAIRCIKRDADALFVEKQISDFLPRLAPLAQIANEIKMRLQDAVERPAAAFWLCRFGHHGAE